jgi:hypothetical protein
MNPSDGESSELPDFREVLSHPIHGEYPLLVGGHAVSLWAMVYLERIGDAIGTWLPLTSKDLDLYGTLETLEALKRRFGGDFRLSGPRSPVVGRLVVELSGSLRKIDVLREVVGLHRSELASGGVQLEVTLGDAAHIVRVLSVPTLLQAKVSNLATLAQDNRNDFKHVNLLLPVVREFLADLVAATERNALDSRACIRALEQVLTIIRSPAAEKCSRLHGIRFDPVWPRKALEAATDPRLRNFVKHRLPEEAP